MYKIIINNTLITLISATILTACAGGNGMPMNNMAGGFNPIASMENSLVNSMTQNVASSLLGGQIGSQLTGVDQNFRMQQINSALQSGSITQPQQWVNQSTGSIMAMNPVGQTITNAQQHQCQNMQESVTLPNGQTVTENRTACLNPQTGQWSLQ